MRIALHGPLYSGKTRLAQELVDEHGFVLVNYTDYLKTLAVRALSSIGVSSSVEEIKANKGQLRGYLQWLGTKAGFDEGGYVEQCLIEQAAGATGMLPERIVFDNVRRQAQIDILRKYGFQLVRVDVPLYLQIHRAAEQGISEEATLTALSHPVEQPLLHQPGEICLVNNGEYSISDIAAHLVEILKGEVAA